MKKINSRFKSYSTKRAFDEARRKTKYKVWRKQRNKYLGKLSKSKRQAFLVDERNYREMLSHDVIPAPSNFSFLENYLEMIDFIAKIKIKFEERKTIQLDLRLITNLEYDGILVLLSVLTRFKSMKIGFSAKKPKDKLIKQKLEKADFFGCLETKIKDVNKYQFGKESGIFTIADREVKPEVTMGVILGAAEKIWGEKRRCPSVQTVFLELMQNTIAHATGSEMSSSEISKRKHWWCTIDFSKEGKVKFSFVDYGIGVFRSLENKPTGSKWFGFNEKIRHLPYFRNSKLFEDLLNGKIHKTVTGEEFRGKGLPGIMEIFKSGMIKHLSIITNDVYFDGLNDVYIDLQNQFEGTYVCWEMDLDTPSFKIME